MINDYVNLQPFIQDPPIGEGIRRVEIRDRHTGETIAAHMYEKHWQQVLRVNEYPEVPK